MLKFAVKLFTLSLRTLGALFSNLITFGTLNFAGKLTIYEFAHQHLALRFSSKCWQEENENQHQNF